MELFNENGCLTDEGLQALVNGQLDELGRLEAAEHLSYCDHCLDRYTALLTADALEEPPRSVHKTVMGTIWVRLMQNTWGRAAAAGVAAVLALTMWRSGTVEQLMGLRQQVKSWTPGFSQSQQQDAEGPLRLGCPVNDNYQPADEQPLGQPVETAEPQKPARFTDALNTLLFGRRDAADSTHNTTTETTTK